MIPDTLQAHFDNLHCIMATANQFRETPVAGLAAPNSLPEVTGEVEVDLAAFRSYLDGLIYACFRADDVIQAIKKV